MVRHIVMWKLVEFPSAAEKEAAISRIKSGLEALAGVVPGLKEVHVATAFDGFDLCLSTAFESRSALLIYQNHPEHAKVRTYIHTVIAERAFCDWEE